jgi:hypothetical protein
MDGGVVVEGTFSICNMLQVSSAARILDQLQIEKISLNENFSIFQSTTSH